MDIKIITIHAIPNFGSAFQSYALCEFLKNNDFNNVELIDYRPKYFDRLSLKGAIGRIIYLKSVLERNYKFKKFIKANLPLTIKKYNNIKKIKKDELFADIFIAGGDQLWNVFHDCGKDDAYKLTWTNGKKISYGTSLGQSLFSEDELIELTSKISDFSHVSVRESNSVNLLKNNGITAVHCVDPVFLLKPESYLPFIKDVKEEKYLLVYLVTPSKLLDDCIDYFAAKYNLKVILCSGLSKKCKCDKFYRNLGPEEVLSYIYNADLILTSSFHAVSFSMMFNKKVLTILPHEKTNERITDILNIVNSTDRIITEKTDLDKVNVLPLTMNDNFENLIVSSKEYLFGALSDD